LNSGVVIESALLWQPCATVKRVRKLKVRLWLSIVCPLLWKWRSSPSVFIRERLLKSRSQAPPRMVIKSRFHLYPLLWTEWRLMLNREEYSGLRDVSCRENSNLGLRLSIRTKTGLSGCSKLIWEQVTGP